MKPASRRQQQGENGMMAGPDRRIGWRGLLAGLVLVLAGCATMPEGVTPGTVSDPYADLPGGGARYTGDLGAGGPVGMLAGIGSAEGFAASAGTTVHFAEGQVTLSEDARRIIADQARWLIQNRGFTARIEGHSNEEGTRDYNLALGARRAAAVQEYLIASGVEAGRLSTVSYGKERPPPGCTEAACPAGNRRVVTTVAPGAGA